MSGTYRQLQRAVGLLIAGAMREHDNGMDGALSPLEVYDAIVSEVGDWMNGTFDELDELKIAQRLNPRLMLPPD